MSRVDQEIELAAFIREVDGNNDMGACKLAERILEWQAARQQAVPSVCPRCLGASPEKVYGASAAFPPYEICSNLEHVPVTYAANTAPQAEQVVEPLRQNMGVCLGSCLDSSKIDPSLEIRYSSNDPAPKPAGILRKHDGRIVCAVAADGSVNLWPSGLTDDEYAAAFRVAKEWTRQRDPGELISRLESILYPKGGA